MAIMAKAAVAVDINDWERISSLVERVGKPDLIDDIRTPDTTYRCVYWEYIGWFGDAVDELTAALDGFRHSMIVIREDGDVMCDVVESDKNGIDEEFSELLSWKSDICWWQSGEPLAPEREYVPMSRERLIEVFKRYVAADAEAAAECRYVYEALCLAGLEQEEIRALGFGYVIPEDEEDCEAPFVHTRLTVVL